ncbi:MAG: hypothetical protein JNL72_13030 [Flavipsychrobacter sp.]|nr:hypothetical protein [Flavipsychrobacter sp.]
MRTVWLILAIFVLCPGVLLAKKKKKRVYTTQDILLNADSLLRTTMGDSLFRFCRLDAASGYRYRQGKKASFSHFTTTRKLPKNFDRAFMRYHFVMPWAECPLYDTISGVISFEVRREDTVFGYSSEPWLGMIPEAAVAHTPCPFISAQEAISIALADTLVRGVNPPYAELHYLPAQKEFRWLVYSLTWNERDFNHDKESFKDIVQLHAETGTIIQHRLYPYATDIETITADK